MDSNAKDIARSKWRQSRSKRGSRTRGRGPGSLHGPSHELTSNHTRQGIPIVNSSAVEGARPESLRRCLAHAPPRYDRGEEEDDKTQQPPTTAAAAAAAAQAAPQKQSQGADLEALLADTGALFAQAHYRHRALLQPPSTEPPVVDVVAAEQVGALCQAL